MLPAGLAAVGVEMVIGPPAVRADDPPVAADQLAEAVAVAVLGDPEDRRFGRGRGPQRAPLARGGPAGLVDVERRRVQDRGDQRLVGQARTAEERWQIASTEPTDSPSPNRSRASSDMSRRETRLRAVIVTTA